MLFQGLHKGHSVEKRKILRVNQVHKERKSGGAHEQSVAFYVFANRFQTMSIPAINKVKVEGIMVF